MPIDFTPVKADPRLKELGIHRDTYGNFDFAEVARELQSLKSQGKDGEQKYFKIVNTLGPEDFFFFCYFVLDLPVNHPFIIARIYEVAAENDRTIDLWARSHWKSTLLTFALPIWELVKSNEERICIFSCTRDLAKAHMRKIKHELEQNVILWKSFPDIFYHEPERKAPKWSENEGLYVRRRGQYPAASIEAWGLVERLPTGKHFTIRIYDDIVTEAMITTRGQLEKIERQFRLSDAVGNPNNPKKNKKRIIGTRYSHKDLYGTLIDSPQEWKVRLYPAEVDEEGGPLREGTAVLMDPKQLDQMYADMGEYIYNAQMLQNPVSGGMQLFRRSWIKEYTDYSTKPYMNRYIICDPGEVDKPGADYSCFLVIGVDYLKNYWMLDMKRDRFELGEKWETLREMVLKWEPISVGYEINKGYTDVQYFAIKMQDEGVHFHISELKSYRGNSKTKRIRDMQALFEKSRVVFPMAIPYTDKHGVFHDLINEFIEDEYLLYPFPKHDDMLDALSFVLDAELGIIFPTQKTDTKQQKYQDDPLNMRKGGDYNGGGSWMSY